MTASAVCMVSMPAISSASPPSWRARIYAAGAVGRAWNITNTLLCNYPELPAIQNRSANRKFFAAALAVREFRIATLRAAP